MLTIEGRNGTINLPDNQTIRHSNRRKKKTFRGSGFCCQNLLFTIRVYQQFLLMSIVNQRIYLFFVERCKYD
nr:MAG TPA: hypothetical protein [Caudoviricetes sp.]